MVVALLFSVICPSIAFSYLVWSNRAGLAVCTLGVYLLETAAQLISETAFVRQGLKCYFAVYSSVWLTHALLQCMHQARNMRLTITITS